MSTLCINKSGFSSHVTDLSVLLPAKLHHERKQCTALNPPAATGWTSFPKWYKHADYVETIRGKIHSKMNRNDAVTLPLHKINNLPSVEPVLIPLYNPKKAPQKYCTNAMTRKRLELPILASNNLNYIASVSRRLHSMHMLAHGIRWEGWQFYLRVPVF